MNKTQKPSFDKHTVPQNFTMGFALVDLLPVVLFGCSALVLGSRMNSLMFMTGAMICLAAGVGKVLWKILVVLIKKNIWPLFMQMRVLMPAGFALMIAGVIACNGKFSLASAWAGFVSFPSVIFFLLGIAGMVLMSVFAVKLDSGDVRANWTEQLTNAAAQACFLIGLLCL